MENITLNDFQSIEIALPVSKTFLTIILASCFGEWIAFLYRKFGISLGNREALSNNFWLLCVTTSIVIMVVKFSIALSLGLVGALSIVRFRAAIKEPEELVNLFLVITIGIACGAGQFKPAFILVFLTTIVFYLRNFFISKKIQKKKYDFSNGTILTFSGPINLKKELDKFLTNLDIKGGYKIVNLTIDQGIFEISIRINNNINQEQNEAIFEWSSKKSKEGLKIRYGIQDFMSY
jgi:uncharacterized membrane protein YhiD involved in acid resistance